MSGGSDALSAADALLEVGQPERAIPLLQSHISGHPNDVLAHTLLARAYYGVDDYTSARDSAREALTRAPEHENALRLLALALASLGERYPAIQAAEQAQRIAPDNWATHHVRMSVDIIVGKYSQVGRNSTVPLLRLAPDLATSYVIAANHILNLSTILSKQEREHAREYLTRALAIDPQHNVAQYLLGNLEVRSIGRSTKSLRPTLDSLAGDPTHRANRRILLTVLTASVRLLAWAYTVLCVWFGFATAEPGFGNPSTVAVIAAIVAALLTLAYFWHLSWHLGRQVLTIGRAIPRVSVLFTLRLGVMGCSFIVLLALPLLSLRAGALITFLLVPLLFGTGVLALLDSFRVLTWREQWREWTR